MIGWNGRRPNHTMSLWELLEGFLRWQGPIHKIWLWEAWVRLIWAGLVTDDRWYIISDQWIGSSWQTAANSQRQNAPGAKALRNKPFMYGHVSKLNPAAKLGFILFSFKKSAKSVYFLTTTSGWIHFLNFKLQSKLPFTQKLSLFLIQFLCHGKHDKRKIYNQNWLYRNWNLNPQNEVSRQHKHWAAFPIVSAVRDSLFWCTSAVWMCLRTGKTVCKSFHQCSSVTLCDSWCNIRSPEGLQAASDVPFFTFILAEKQTLYCAFSVE